MYCVFWVDVIILSADKNIIVYDICLVEMTMKREEILGLCNSNPDAVVAFIETRDARIVELEVRNGKLEAWNVELAAKIADLRVKIDLLEVRIAELEALHSQNSRNSSRPPSTDVFIRPGSLRMRGERSVGGQPGHKGCTLKQVEVPDIIIDHNVVVCDTCGAFLAGVAVSDVERRQVFEIPPLKIVVSEHRAETKQCPCCGGFTRAGFPRGVLHPVQYGGYLKAFVVYLLVFQFVPYDRIAVLFSDLFGHSPGRATLVRAVESCYNNLAIVEDVIQGLLRDERVVNVDETGFRAKGRRQWLHVACTRLLTWYGHHRNRGMVAMRAFGILPRVTGTIVHDFWKPYLGLGCGHAFCNAHIIRELEGVSETFHQEWSGRMKELLCLIKNRVDATRLQATCLGPGQVADFESRYQEIIMSGQGENPVPADLGKRSLRGSRRQSKAKNLLDRCRDYQKQVLAFMYDFNVPFDNNQAERDIRMAKLQQKISGTSRSDDGAAWFCRIRGYISTVRKNNQPVLVSLVKAFEGRPFIPQNVY